jgi:two-component system alkaline phosphatase synthesis response regulator PhoP
MKGELVGKVLVVEDHPDMLEVLSWQMEMLGFTVITANRGEEAVNKAIEEKPQLILMDMMMPGMDGLEATRLIRANPETRNIPILAATVFFRESDLRNCIDAGCNDFIVKPFTFQELQGKIQEFIPESHLSLQ